MRNLVGSLLFCLAFSAILTAAPAGAATQVAAVNGTAVKPLELTRIQDLELGSISLTPGSWSATVSLSQAGVLSCANANLICTGAVKTAKYNVTGSNNMVVLIHAPNVTLVNQSDSTKTLTLVADAPSSVTLTSSGAPGVTFPIGGRITLTGSTTAGDYTGTFNVTVEYQ
jgi:hypothetical protein